MKARSREGTEHNHKGVALLSAPGFFPAPSLSLPPPGWFLSLLLALIPGLLNTQARPVCVCAMLFTYLKYFWLPGLFLCFTNTSRITQTRKTVWNQYPSVLGKKMVERRQCSSFAFCDSLLTSFSCWSPWVCTWLLLSPLFLSSVIDSCGFLCWDFTLSWAFSGVLRGTWLPDLLFPGPRDYL